ncbi:MAG: hypothetical protein JO165_06310 [Candidatus Eremiobacteraeota bacterium]|nr:hypothetical protein [Candidatus Eremiobacteraeota bacterium]
MKTFITTTLAALCLAMIAAPVSAQTSSAPPDAPVCGYWDSNGSWVDSGQCEKSSYCGSEVNGAWVANGNCPDEHGMMRRAFVRGTITSVKGHLVTLQQSRGSVVIDDTPALNAQTSGKVAVGRQVTAVGYWKDGTFYATELQ